MHMPKHRAYINQISHIDPAEYYCNSQNQFKIIIQNINNRQREYHHAYQIILCTKYCQPIDDHISGYRNILKYRTVFFTEINKKTSCHRNYDRKVHCQHKAEPDVTLRIISYVAKK